MKQVLITGSLGLIGYTTALYYLKKNYRVIGIDNDFRTKSLHSVPLSNQKLKFLQQNFPSLYTHYNIDIQHHAEIANVLHKYNDRISLIVHTAAQTSHDWSKLHPVTDYSINAISTLHLLESVREYNPGAVFLFTSTNKVYGDLVNTLEFDESDLRYDLPRSHHLYDGITEQLSLDQSTHSIFGASKLAADILVQEYAHYYGLQTGVFRLGVVAGPGQSGAFLQGFLAYMIHKIKQKEIFKIVGYHGKQVRDIIHAEDVVLAFDAFFSAPKPGSVYNMGGGRANSASIRELLQKIEVLCNTKTTASYDGTVRQGDHKWWITDTSKFKKDYPNWRPMYTLDDIITALYNQTT